jgi:hypothetical protein
MHKLLLVIILFAPSHYNHGQSLIGPAICLEGLKYNDTISIDNINNVMRLNVCNDTDGSLTISTFRMSRYYKGLDPVVMTKSDGNALSGQMLALLLNSPAGSKILFEYVKAVRKDGREINVGTLSLTKK